MSTKSINKNAKKVDIFMKKYFNNQNQSGLIKSMKYSSLSGGIKIRTSMIIGTGKLFNLDIKTSNCKRNKLLSGILLQSFYNLIFNSL